MRAACSLAILALACSSSSDAYIRFTTGPVQTQGTPLTRADFANVQFLVNSSLTAGATNAGGETTITPRSDPFAAIQAAMNTWNNVSTSAARFAPPQPSALSNDPLDRNHVITMEDTPENRSIVGDLMGVTMFSFTTDGSIVDTDIILNPSIVRDAVQMPYSTNHEMGTVDLQSVITHELGHAFGASHAALLSATMFQSSVAAEPGASGEATLWSTLSPDDIAFVSTAYPAADAGLLLCSITGQLSFPDGSPVRGALVTAVDPSTGIAVGSISNFNDGTYSIAGIPPGTYQVYAEPLDAPVFPGYLYLPDSAPIDTSFRTSFYGGLDQPGSVALTAGTSSPADIVVDGAAPALNLCYIGVDHAMDSIRIADSARVLEGSQSIDVLLFGPGIDGNATVRLLGPATVQDGSLRADPSITVNGWIALRFTVNAAAVTTPAAVTILVNNGPDASALSGGLLIVPPPVQ